MSRGMGGRGAGARRGRARAGGAGARRGAGRGAGGPQGRFAGRVGRVGLGDPAGLWGAAWAMANAFRPEWPPPMTWAYAANRALGLALASLEPAEPRGEDGDGSFFCCLGAEGLAEGDERVSGAATLDNRSFYTPGPGPDGFRWPLRRWHGYIANVAVLRGARRRGVARALVSEAESLAARWGCQEVFITVEVDNDAALTLYEAKCGFKRIDSPHFFELPGREGGESASALVDSKSSAAAEPDSPSADDAAWLGRVSSAAKNRLRPLQKRKPLLCTRYPLRVDGTIEREGDTNLIVLHKSVQSSV